MSQLHSLHATRQWAASHAHVTEQTSDLRVSIAWISRASALPVLEGAEFELGAELDLSRGLAVVAQRAGWTWLAALAQTQCDELVLTAAVDSAPAKHRLLALAELLTIEFSARHAVVRVRFLPPSRAPQQSEVRLRPRSTARHSAAAR